DNLDPQVAPYTLMPRPLYASDILYGGLGGDALHGGAGDDALLGAEAPMSSYTDSYNAAGTQLNAGFVIESDFAHPYNPGNVLGYSPATTKFAQYDANDPLRKILLSADGTLSKSGTGYNWLLNFDATEGPLDAQWFTASYAALPTDGNDTMFGDLGHDWLVDWRGEFNSFLTPYAPFGMASVSRTLQPQLPEYLYALSASDGADPTLAARYLSDAARNGEPYGELGLLRQTDAAIADNRGKPRDPQAGNLPGGKRDVLRTSGSQPINSPGTFCVPPVAPSRLVPAPTP